VSGRRDWRDFVEEEAPFGALHEEGEDEEEVYGGEVAEDGDVVVKGSVDGQGLLGKGM
jgi:hypothetical protein